MDQPARGEGVRDDDAPAEHTHSEHTHSGHAVTPSPDDRSRDKQLGELADRIVRVARRIEAHRFQDSLITPVSPLEALFLRYVDDHPGASPGVLARDLMVRSSNASAGLRSLERKGLITRSADRDDARVTRLFVTDDARRATARVRVEWAHLLSELLPPSVNVAGALHVLELLDDAPAEREP
ncbi:MarR family winged helix-turn-helix transcriptional regulator [Propionibacterium freudenreichii]|uniref:MarR family winged helix-turn-helix transcriptional regulator n=1 Tax=Propionibacterium freudenreichii TaxID=1744 RepID=UPI00254B761E|nr:MarR family transcriptional regulator [Propionibacterium freudenreichii]MDK9350025.1 MarR family transcriptional regulator [Propionibacterium freudenreichii]